MLFDNIPRLSISSMPMFKQLDGSSLVGHPRDPRGTTPIDTTGPGRRCTALILSIMTLVWTTTLTACAGTGQADPVDHNAVLPLTSRVEHTSESDKTTRNAHTELATTDGDQILPEDDSSGRHRDNEETDADPSDDGAAADIAWLITADVLRRYDEAVTALAVEPAITADVNSEARRVWSHTVPEGSFLHDDVLERLVLEPLATGTRLLAGPDGVSYRHHVTGITDADQNTISFTWCGYAPGIRIDSRSGAVVDDAIARMGGVGRTTLRPVPAGNGRSSPGAMVTDPSPVWMLEEFDHLDYDVLPPGSDDPCVD